MKNQKFPVRDPLTLHSMVHRISSSSLYAATKKHSFIINDVQPDLEVTTDSHLLASIFGTLLNTVITHSENSCIRISAKLYGKVALLQLKESPQLNHFSFSRKLKEVQQLAEMIGGTVSISKNNDRSTSIVFSFINNLSLAA